MDRVVVLDDYQGVASTVADWTPITRRTEVEFQRDHAASEDDLVRRLTGVQVVVAMRERTAFPESVLSRLADLRLLVTTGMRNASIDLAAAHRHGITVSGTALGGASTAELTWGLILGLLRDIPRESMALREGRWQVGRLGEGVRGKTLGVVGLGRLGSEVAAVGRAFGMDVLAWSQNLTSGRAAEHGAELAGSLGDLMERSDVVTVHTQLSDRTRGLIDEAAIARMRPTAYLVNTSRAAIVDQDALRGALAAGAIRGAAIDVFDVEPLPAGDPWLALDHVILTPHLGYVTAENFATMYAEAIEDILAFWAGTPLRLLD